MSKSKPTGKKATSTPKKSLKRTESKNFISKIMPESGNYCVVTKDAGNGNGINEFHWFISLIAALKFISFYVNKGLQVYLAQATFKKPGTEKSGRKQEDAAFLKNFFFDIDCGIGKPYPTQAEGKAALLAFCEKTGLPIPAIVNSGNGLYAHWPLITAIAAALWMVVAKKLKTLVHAIEPGLDKDGLIADSSRILRTVGTLNLKDPDNPKKVTLLQDCEPVELDSFEKKVDDALAALPAKQVPAPKVEVDKSSSGVQIKAKATLIAEQCPVIEHIRDTPSKVSEPLWYNGIGVLRHCEESPSIIHEWSKGHSDYSYEETEAKIEQHNYPPTTCEKFADLRPELCANCKHKGKITSPISLGMQKIPKYLEDLDKKHFVSRLGGKTYVFLEARDELLERRVLHKSSFGDFKNYYNNKNVVVGKKSNGDPIMMPLGDSWLKHEERRQFEGIIMAPEGDKPGYYNLWQGFAVKPSEGSWELMRRHLLNVICNRDKKLYYYVKNWLARLVQEPWKQGEVALVLRGGRGVGKGLLANNLCKILGQHACAVRNSTQVTGNFNAHLDDTIMLYIDEAWWAGNKEGEGVLKGLITEPTLFIVPKHIDGKTSRNMLHIIMTSNNDWVVPAGADERRYCVLDVSDRRQNDRAYFDALIKEIENGGLGAMLYDLLQTDISNFEVRDVPQTEALLNQKLLSLEPLYKWWYDKLHKGELLSDCGWNPVPVQALYDDYVSSTKKQGNNYPGSETAFGINLRKVLPEKWDLKDRESSKNMFGKRSSVYKFPSLKVCRISFAKFLRFDNMDWK
jgi:hypothetical protein